MPSLFASAATTSFFTRTKRKLSGVGNALALDIHDDDSTSDSVTSPRNCLNGNNTSSNSSTTASTVSLLLPSCANSSSSFSTATPVKQPLDHYASTNSWLCAVFQSVDVREVAAFALWKVLCVSIVVLAVADWVFFFKFVVAVDAPRTRATNGALWAALTVALLAFRRAVRAKCGSDICKLADHLEVFIAVSLVMVFATNIAFYLHAPASSPLPDLGFLLVPAQADDSKWRPLSDILTALMPVFGLVQTLLMSRANRCRVITTFFRVATIAYALRTLTVALTSLPGPAPHCRPGSALYHPPQTWIDIVTRVGPMYGQFHSCGDLIFSGHMAYTNSALLLYLRTMDRHMPRFARLRWAIGGLFLLTLAALCIAGRKHYSVDVVLGVVISTLVFFHFEHAWVPPSLALHSVDVGQHQMLYAGSNAGSKLSGKASALERLNESSEHDALLYRTPNAQSAVDYIC